jgi:fucose permease
VIRNVPNTGNANAILDPTLLAKLPPAIVHAIRAALADSLHDIYVFAGAILVLALIATVFMKEVSLQTTKPAAGFEAPPVEDEEEEREGRVAAG